MQIEISPKTVVASGSFGPLATTLAMRLEGRKTWNSHSRLTFETSQHNISLFLSLWPSAKVEDKRDEDFSAFDLPGDSEAPEPVPQFVMEPRDFQLENFNRFKNQSQWAIFSEQGCVDKDTEYLSRDGWIKISEYKGGDVAQYNLNGIAEFVTPHNYLAKPCNAMAHFKTKYGCDQMLSLDHRMLLRTENKESEHGLAQQEWCKYVSSDLIETTPSKMIERFGKCADVTWRHRKVPSTFLMDGEEHPISDDELRLQIAFMADGSYGTRAFDNPPRSTRKGCIRIKKERKKQRLVELLTKSKILFERKEIADGFSLFRFVPPIATKHFVDSFWWGLSSW